MRKKIFYYIKRKNNTPKHIFKNKKSSLYRIANDKYYFNSHYHEEIEIIIEPRELVFNKDLCNILKYILKQAKSDIYKLSKSGTGDEKIPGHMYSCIYSEIKKSIHNKPYSIFEFIGNIFIKILMFHYLWNGNKRMSLLFLIYSLNYLGYYFMYTKGIYENYNWHEKKLELIVKDLIDNKSNNKIISEIIDWIEGNSLLSVI